MFLGEWLSALRQGFSRPGASRRERAARASRRNKGRLARHFEQLEDRILLAINLRILNAYLVDGNGNSTSQVVEGQQIQLGVRFTTEDLLNVLTDNWKIRFEVDGVPGVGFVALDTANRPEAGANIRQWSTHTAATVAAPLGDAFVNTTIVPSQRWFATPGPRTARVTLDPTNTLAESNENDNVFQFSFTPISPLSLPGKFVQPIGGTPFKDWSVLNYADLNPTQFQTVDYRGNTPFFFFSSSGDSATGIDLVLPNFAKMDAGMPVLAAAGGTVSAVQDGNFDHETFSFSFVQRTTNLIRIDHGGGWQTQYSSLANGSIAVKVGDVVKAGELIALVGSSGNSATPHLNFDVQHDGSSVETGYNPTTYFINPLPYQDDEKTTLTDLGITNDPFYFGDFLERPTSVNVFPTSQNWDVVLWMRVSHFTSTNFFNTFDRLVVKWFRPDGILAKTSNSFQFGGRWQSPSFTLFNAEWFQFPGTWEAVITNNNYEIGRTTFKVVKSVLNVPSTLGEPSIRVSTGSQLLDGRMTPIDFGSTAIGSFATPLRTITIENQGAVDLTLSNVVMPPGFKTFVFSSFPPRIAPGAVAFVTLQLDSTAAGKQFGEVRFDTNDPFHSTFSFNVTGLVTGANPTGTPDITLTGTALAYPFGQPPKVIDAGATVTDSDSANFNGGKLTVEFAGGAGSGDKLAIRNQGVGPTDIGVSGANVTYGGTTIGTFTGGASLAPLVVSFNSNATPAIAQALVRNIVYSNTSLAGTAPPRYVRFTIVDDTGKKSNQPVKEIILGPDVVPQGTLTAGNITTAGGTVQIFTVRYTAIGQIDVSSLDSADIVVTGPNGFSRPATFMVVDDITNGTPRIASYFIDAPGGSWDAADNGTYTVSLKPNQVRDTAGQFAFGGDLGTFDVNIPLPPDLRGVSFALKGKPYVAGSSFNVDFQIENIGESPAPSFRVDFYLSKTATIDPLDYFLGTYTVTTPVDAATTSGVFTATLNLPTPTNRFWAGDGTYFIGMNVDGTGIFNELNKLNNNNRGLGLDVDSVTITGTAGSIAPDLVGTSFTALGKPYTTGATFNVDYQVQNAGNAPAPGSVVTFFLSTDGTITDQDHPLGSAAIPALAPGASTALLQKTLTLPAFGDPFWSGDATYFIGMIVDGGGTINESDEANNSSQALGKDVDTAFVLTSAPPVPPDLLGNAFHVNGPAQVTAGGIVNVDFQVANTGAGPTGAFRVDFYLSTDATISTQDLLLGSQQLPPLAPTSLSNVLQQTLALPAPGDLFWVAAGDGPYFLGMIVDAGSAYLETDETNNSSQGIGLDVASIAVQGTAGATPADLYGTLLSAVSKTTVAGSGFGADFSVANGGLSAAGPFRVDFFLSKDSTITTNDYALGSYQVNGLSAGATTGSIRRNFSLPGANDPFWSGDGTYYIGMIVDAGNAVAESNESNNSSQGAGVDFDAVFVQGAIGTPQPDLLGQSFHALGGPYTAGGTFNINFSAKNAGGADAGPFRVDFYVSREGAGAASALVIGSYQFAGLPAGTSTATTGATLTLPAVDDRFWSGDGAYHIGMIVDAGGNVAESNESNNSTQGLLQDADTNTIVGTSAAARTTERMFRAYNPNADYHFFTTSQAEFANAVAHGYRDETTGRSGFSVLASQTAGATAVFRMYNPHTGRHYYTLNSVERDSLIRVGWRYEKDEGFMYPTQVAGTTEIFRLYNRNTGVHLYTQSAAVKNSILTQLGNVWVQHSSLGFAFLSSSQAPATAGAVQAPATAAASSVTNMASGGAATASSSATESASDRFASTLASPNAATTVTGVASSAAPATGDSGSAGDSAHVSAAPDERPIDRVWNEVGRSLLANSSTGLLE